MVWDAYMWNPWSLGIEGFFKRFIYTYDHQCFFLNFIVLLNKYLAHDRTFVNFVRCCTSKWDFFFWVFQAPAILGPCFANEYHGYSYIVHVAFVCLCQLLTCSFCLPLKQKQDLNLLALWSKADVNMKMLEQLVKKAFSVKEFIAPGAKFSKDTKPSSKSVAKTVLKRPAKKAWGQRCSLMQLETPFRCERTEAPKRPWPEDWIVNYEWLSYIVI